MNSFDIVSRLPFLVVMLLLACQAVSADENLRGSEVAAANNTTLDMVYYDYDYDVLCYEGNFPNFGGCSDNPEGKLHLDKTWLRVWVKVQDKNLAIPGVLSSYGLFVDYAEGGRLDWSGTLMIGGSTFPYTKVDGVSIECKEENNVPTNLRFDGYRHQYQYATRDTWYIDHDTVECPPAGRRHMGAAGSYFYCEDIVNQNTGEYIPVWNSDKCYYKTLDDVKYMTRLLTPEQVARCYDEYVWDDDDRVCF